MVNRSITAQRAIAREGQRGEEQGRVIWRSCVGIFPFIELACSVDTQRYTAANLNAENVTIQATRLNVLPHKQTNIRTGARDIDVLLFVCAARCEMDIIVYYGTSEVARYHVDNPFGCRLFYYPNLDKKLSVLNLLDPDGTEFHLAFGSRTRTQINLPTPDRDRDPDSVQLQLLEGFQRGLLLDFVSNDLFATRLCQCALYCSDSRFKTSEEGKLWTKERTKVFDYRQRFEPCFKRHCAGDAKCPSSELFLTFGRTWNADKDAAEESTVSVAIVHCLARSQIQAESHDILPSGMSMDIIDPDEGDKELEESLKGRGGGSRTGHQGSPTSSLSSSTD